MNKIPFEQTYHIICFVNFFLNVIRASIQSHVSYLVLFRNGVV